MSDTPVLWEETVQGGATWSHVLKRGTALRITDPEGGANAGALFYNFECPVERYNMPDTLKAQHIARLTAGLRALFRHGPRPLLRSPAIRSAGTTRSAAAPMPRMVRAKYGDGALPGMPQRLSQERAGQLPGGTRQVGPGPARPGAECQLLQPRRPSATMAACNSSRAIRTPAIAVELRAEMNVLVILNTCQHPLDPNPNYAPKPVQLSIRRVPAPAADDPAASPGRRTSAASP